MMAAVWLVGQCSIFVRSPSSWPIHRFRLPWMRPRSNGLQGSSALGRSPAWRGGIIARQKRPGLSGRRPRRSSLIKTLGLTLMSCRASRPNQGTIHSEALREKAASAGATFTLGATRQGRLRLDLSNDLPRFDKNSQQCRP
jgi:hypothetical protein